MKGRDSGMPHKEMWEGFFNPAQTLAVMGLDKDVTDAAEFGCGYGTFTIPAAKMIRGAMHAIDIDAEMIAQTKEAAARAGVKNIHAIRRDFTVKGAGLKEKSVDYVMLFNILHIENPEVSLREAWRILRRGGKLGIIHWNYDAATPRGPSMDIRPKPEQCIQWAREAGFSDPVQYDLKPYHYGIVLTKQGVIRRI
ncbi:MAG: methyltransferase type 11 [Omnitrophica WOR_2 bacterium RIFCSPHIGHO2_01_FULL_52_10]|nr:MAG: methyltransferase type 11 [Omnitrophica WOR_2 bacterium RIFCSPHIGHO2_01_FULL_52_10]